MSRSPSLSPAFPAPTPWTNAPIDLYHGTIRQWESAILAGVHVAAGRTALDFGQGFYTTTLLTQAQSWAWLASSKSKVKGVASNPVVLRFTVSRDALAGLDSVWFVRGATDADDYWSLVTHCRSGGAAHGRSVPVAHARPGWYDVAIGPVAASWKQRLCFLDGDQMSFHSQTAADVLDASSKGVV